MQIFFFFALVGDSRLSTILLERWYESCQNNGKSTHASNNVFKSIAEELKLDRYIIKTQSFTAVLWNFFPGKEARERIATSGTFRSIC